ncbi:hypothetical protein EGR_10193 [Echinococcus granulosus]|uniref:Uncharacterized protein n=1 Tax=Echinococcus granulosus TaxID=6210 RepID=W6U1P3_ECHGR|nr:hypothetical protein EGR_10193 [Echinococcus granulosus]EUB54958.1 hypothetical protein EGR_10193 [Echinococcus granulosus]
MPSTGRSMLEHKGEKVSSPDFITDGYKLFQNFPLLPLFLELVDLKGGDKFSVTFLTKFGKWMMSNSNCQVDLILSKKTFSHLEHSIVHLLQCLPTNSVDLTLILAKFDSTTLYQCPAALNSICARFAPFQDCVN